MEPWIRRRERERETRKESEKLEGLKGRWTWDWLCGNGRKMDLIRSECNSVNVGGLELAVQKPVKGGDQDWAWERHLARWLGTRAQRIDFRARRPREGDTWGTGKDQKEVIAVKISTNTVWPFGLDNKAIMRSFGRTDILGQHKNGRGRAQFSLNRNNGKWI